MAKVLHPVIIDTTHGLLTAETSNDAVIASAAALIQTIVADRGQVRLRFGDIQGPLSDAAKALALGVEARAHYGRAHRRLHELGIEKGLFEPTGHGDIFPTQDDSDQAPKRASASAVDTILPASLQVAA